jgi:hypothetical protein
MSISGILLVMVDTTHSDPARIDALIEQGDLPAARAALDLAPEGDERFAVVRIKLGLYEGSMSPGVVMQQLIQLMRRDEAFPGAKELYQRASGASFHARESSVAHSHPPPPAGVRRRE